MANNMMNSIKQKQHKREKQRENVTTGDLNELSEKEIKSIIMVKDENLIDDPNNEETYGEYEIDALAEDMKANGFIGVIFAYPFSKNTEGEITYRIEGGHRSRYAGRKAGFKEFPVLPTEPPKSKAERIIRLHKRNLHGRKYTPMILARMNKQLYDAHLEELGSKDNVAMYMTTARKQTMADLEISQATFYRLQNLMNLIPELQKVVDSEKFQWTRIADAATLDKEKQFELFTWLNKIEEEERIDSLNANDIKRKIESLKSYDEENEDNIENAKKRKTNGIKAIKKGTDALRKVLKKDKESYYYDEKEIPEVIEELELLKYEIDEKIKKLKNQK